MSKVCCKCGVTKPLDCFTLKRGKPNAQCKACKYSKEAEYRQKNKEKTAKRNLLYWEKVKGSPEQVARNIRKCSTYREKHPEVGKHHAALRRALVGKATPLWEDLVALRLFYSNCPSGYEVDHIIPLKHSLVCGLHTLANLQYLTKEENRKKYNNFLTV